MRKAFVFATIVAAVSAVAAPLVMAGGLQDKGGAEKKVAVPTVVPNPVYLSNTHNQPVQFELSTDGNNWVGFVIPSQHGSFYANALHVRFAPGGNTPPTKRYKLDIGNRHFYFFHSGDAWDLNRQGSL